MNIITISREFGSGGRELGKRMADLLGWDYYDREIIQQVADEKGLDSDYVSAVLERHDWRSVPITFTHSFAADVYQSQKTSLLIEEKKVIDRIGAAGNDCIIVGRNADVYLRDKDPFTVFVCADLAARVRRCRDRAPEGEQFSDRELERQIRRIDKNRALVREMIDGTRWGDRTCYNLTVNTTDRSIKELAPLVAAYAKGWLEQKKG